MSLHPTPATQHKIDLAYRYSLILKGLHAVLELMSSVVILFISQATILNALTFLTQDELSEDPKDALTQYLFHAAQSFSVGTRNFLFFYLFSHGLIKLILVIALLRKKVWAYHASVAVFSIFILYQLYRFTYTHSLWLLVFSVIDGVIIWLIWEEYTALPEKSSEASASR